MENQELAKAEALEITQRISTLQREKEDAVARSDFALAAHLRESEIECRSTLKDFNFPDYVFANLQRLAESSRLSRFPVLDMLETEPGAPDPKVLQQWPASVESPISFAFEQIPESPSGTLRKALNVDDVFSLHFQAKLPVLCPETVNRFKSQTIRDALQAMFIEITRCKQQGVPAVLSLVAPTSCLDSALHSTVLHGLKESSCDVVVFQHAPAIHDIAAALLPEITLCIS